MKGGVALASGKGGTGKSVFCASLVQELLGMGFRVGAVDVDYSNPNLGRLLRFPSDATIQTTADRKYLIPANDGNGLSFFSIEKVLEDRGVMMTGEGYEAITRDVLARGIWEVDYMLLDLPAVISNEFRTVVSVFENNYLGSIIVAQPSALQTTDKVIRLHIINGIPILGVVENTMNFTCPNCKTETKLLGEGGAEELCRQYDVPWLGSLPYDPIIQEQLKANKKVRLQEKELLSEVATIISQSEPQKLGFIQEAKQAFKSIGRDVMMSLLNHSLPIINRTVDIKDLAAKHRIISDQVIALHVLDDKMLNELLVINLKIRDGVLRILDPSLRVVPDLSIYIRQRAFAWIMIQQKKFPDGRAVPYTPKDALANGDLRISGLGGVIRGLAFYNDLWESAHTQLVPVLNPIVEKLV